MGVSELKHQAKVEEWKQRIMDCRSSGLTVKQWCAAYGGNSSTYDRWERELFKKNAVCVENSIQAIDNHPKAFPVLAELAVATPQQECPAKNDSFVPAAIIRVGQIELELSNAVSADLRNTGIILTVHLILT